MKKGLQERKREICDSESDMVAFDSVMKFLKKAPKGIMDGDDLIAKVSADIGRINKSKGRKFRRKKDFLEFIINQMFFVNTDNKVNIKNMSKSLRF